VDRLVPGAIQGTKPINRLVDAIVNCISDSLLAAEIFLSGLDRNMSKQKLDLFQFTTSNVA